MKSTRGFAVGLQLLLAGASTFTSASADTDGVLEVGIGSLHPICNPLQEECTLSDEQVQNDIIAALVAEDTVVGTSPRVRIHRDCHEPLSRCRAIWWTQAPHDMLQVV